MTVNLNSLASTATATDSAVCVSTHTTPEGTTMHTQSTTITTSRAARDQSAVLAGLPVAAPSTGLRSASASAPGDSESCAPGAHQTLNNEIPVALEA